MVSLISSTMRPGTPTEVPAPAATKSLHRRPTLVRKRSDSNSIEPASMETTSIPSSPSKRSKVTFDNEVKVRTVEDEGDKSFAVVREEVRITLLRHMQGDSERYSQLKLIFAKHLADNERPTSTSLRNHLFALLGNISLLDRSAGGLVNEIISSHWIGRDESYVKLFIQFLGNLVGAHGGWCSNVMRMLVTHLGDVPGDIGRQSDCPVVRKSQIFDRAHAAIRYLLQLIPTSLAGMPELLSRSFPADHWTVHVPVDYTKNLLRIISYAPHLQSDIIALIISQLVNIDVHVQVDIEDLDDDMSEEIVNQIAKLNDEDYESDVDAESEEEDIDPESERLKAVKMNIIRLDMMMDILFSYYSPIFSSSLNSKESALDLLLGQFHNRILPTYRSRHTQFILFHFSQTSVPLIDRFASTCIDILMNKRQPQFMRQSSAYYLASFVARGVHVPASVVRDVFDLLSTYLNELRADYEPTCRGPELRRYAMFYSTAQALFYIFCFRWRDLATPVNDDNSDSEEEDEHDSRHFNFSHSIKDPIRIAIYSKLNPLKVCSPLIVAEFARIAHACQFLYVYPLLETNKHVRLSHFRSLATLAEKSRKGFSLPSAASSEAEAWTGEESKWQLDAYFPFDPYHLPRSKRWVEGDYREWKGLDDDEDDNDEDEEDGEGSDIEVGDDRPKQATEASVTINRAGDRASQPIAVE